MNQHLRKHTALAEDPDWFVSAYNDQLTTTCNSGEANNLRPPRTLCAHVYTIKRNSNLFKEGFTIRSRLYLLPLLYKQ